MPLVRVDANLITDWNTFHDVFAQTFGFPGFYGRNMNAWIDCMSYLDDPEAGMTKVHGTPTDPVVLQIDEVNGLPVDIFDAIVECAAFVNWRRIEQGDSAILTLSFYKTA
jgi:RNAse (barnase) inhibitor barstar